MLRRLKLYLGISVTWLALSMLFDGINTLVLPARIAKMINQGQQATALGLLSFAGLLAGLLVQPFAGAISDRWRDKAGRKAVLAVGIGLALVFLFLFGLASSMALLVVGYLLVQISGSIAQAAQQGFIPDLVPASDRGKASGWKAFMDIGGAMLGFVILGYFLGKGDYRLALATIGLALAITFGLTTLLVRERRGIANPELNQTPLASAFRIDLKEHRSFAWLVGSRFLFLLGTYAVGRFLLYFVADRLGVSPEAAAQQAGALLAGLSLATILGAPLAGWASDRWGRIPIVIIGSIVSALGVTLLIFAHSAIQIFAFGALMSLGSAAFASANWALTADLVPAGESARFFGLANIGTAGAAAAAGLFGPLVDQANRFNPGTGYPALFIVSAIAFLLSAYVLRWVQPQALVESTDTLHAYD